MLFLANDCSSLLVPQHCESQCWGTNWLSAALPQKTHGETRVLCSSHGWTVVQSLLAPQNLHGLKTDASFCGTVATMWGTHSLCPTLWQKTHGETPVLCAIMVLAQCSHDLCRSHDWTVVNHYYTQDWGLTMCFLRQCCTHCLCPTLWSQCPKTGSVLAMQPLCRSHGWTVVNHYCTQNWGLTMCFLRQCCTHSLCPHCGHCAPKLARSWPCSLCAEVMIGLS